MLLIGYFATRHSFPIDAVICYIGDSEKTRTLHRGGSGGCHAIDDVVANFSQGGSAVHAANSLCFASCITVMGVPMDLSAARPPTVLISGTSQSVGVSSASVPPISNWWPKLRSTVAAFGSIAWNQGWLELR